MKRPVPAELGSFDQLPSAAHVRLPIVAGLFSAAPVSRQSPGALERR